MIIKAIDCDFGSAAHVPREQEWFDNLVTLGYEGFIACSHTFWNGVPATNPHINTTLQRAVDAGLWVGLYGRPVTHWKEALEVVDPVFRDQLKFFIVDVEDEPGGVYPVKREYIDGVRAMGVRPLMYSGKWLWQNVMGTDRSFSDVPLFEFAGDRTGWPESMDEPPIDQFGGWNESPETLRVAQQVRMLAGYYIDGTLIDDDAFDSDWLFATEDFTPVPEAFVGKSEEGGYVKDVSVTIPTETEEGDEILLHVSANFHSDLTPPVGFDLVEETEPSVGVRNWVFRRTATDTDAGTPVLLEFDDVHWHFGAVTVWRGYTMSETPAVTATQEESNSVDVPAIGDEGDIVVLTGFNWLETTKRWRAPVSDVVNLPRGLTVGVDVATSETVDRALDAVDLGRMSVIGVALSPVPAAPPAPVELPLRVSMTLDRDENGDLVARDITFE